MKLRINFKSPCSVDQSLLARAEAMAGDNPDPDAVPNMMDHLRKEISHWVRYGEYCTIEIDTETKTARVVRVDE